ncbi:hypothetical protein AVEN_87568-1 [Araneus ventricosus]|uniref:Uncharacterized protein n=1 Tax=Araneus ventricosus TaxID=182803 RepID=A0A4Y2IUR1_ARAVE|nr:hypothetical protein AVEN_258624-1 [Araneus ventricosus]GBM80693.1 hypothetical protein AVEN_33793-1 [Araneus ventricosus]GBM80752.1 hypothetical protein AVEN_87568-1 [Araneus ventricosus]
MQDKNIVPSNKEETGIDISYRLLLSLPKQHPKLAFSLFSNPVLSLAQHRYINIDIGLEGGGGLIAAGESSKSSDMLYSKSSSSDAEEELISASASDSRDCKMLFSNGGRTAIGKSSMSTEVGLVVGKGFNAD